MLILTCPVPGATTILELEFIVRLLKMYSWPPVSTSVDCVITSPRTIFCPGGAVSVAKGPSPTSAGRVPAGSVVVVHTDGAAEQSVGVWNLALLVGGSGFGMGGVG